MSLKRVFTDTLLFSMANMGGRVLGMLLVPLYVQYINPDDYGKMDMLQVVITIVSLLVVAGIPSALFRFYHSMPESERPVLVNTGLFGIMLLVLPVSLGLWLAAPGLSQAFFQFEHASLYMRLMIGTMALTLPTDYLSGLLMLKGETRRYVTVKLGYTVISLVLNIVFVAGFKWGILGLLASALVSLVPKLGVLIWFLGKDLRFQIDRVILRRILRFGAPLIMASISGWILSSSDRFFLKHYSTYEQIGLYSIAYKFAGGLNFMVISPVIAAWTRTAFEYQTSPDLPAMFKRITRVFLSIGLLIIVCSSALIPEALVVLTNPKYYGAYLAYPALIASFVAFGLNRMFEIPLQLVNRSALSGVLGSCAMLFNLVFNILLIPRYGILGAALSTFMSYILNNLVFYYFVKKYNPMPYPMAAALGLSLVGLGVVLVTLLPALALGIWAKLPLLLGFGGLVLLWNREEWHRFPPAWLALRRKLKLAA
ncbi:MAG: oligosaccharide flippase family protein [Candidatus Delongbacteria bacterium]